MPAAQSADLGWPSLSPRRYARKGSLPLQQRARKSLSWRPARTISPARPNITAASVLGRTGHHSAGTHAGRSSRAGEIRTKRTPRWTMARKWVCSMCRAMPPASDCAVRGESAPKTTTVSLCRAMVSRVLAPPAQASWSPSTWRRITGPAAVL